MDRQTWFRSLVRAKEMITVLRDGSLQHEPSVEWVCFGTTIACVLQLLDMVERVGFPLEAGQTELAPPEPDAWQSPVLQRHTVLACPFCGSHDLENLDSARSGGAVHCIDCGARGPSVLTSPSLRAVAGLEPADGIEAWSVRFNRGERLVLARRTKRWVTALLAMRSGRVEERCEVLEQGLREINSFLGQFEVEP